MWVDSLPLPPRPPCSPSNCFCHPLPRLPSLSLPPSPLPLREGENAGWRRPGCIVFAGVMFFSLRAGGVTCLLNQLERRFFFFFCHVPVFKCLRVLKKKIQPDANSLKDKSYILYMFLHDCVFWLNFFFKLVLPICAWHCQSIFNWNAVWAIIKLGRRSDRRARVLLRPVTWTSMIGSHGFPRKGWTKKTNSVWMTSCK